MEPLYKIKELEAKTPSSTVNINLSEEEMKQLTLSDVKVPFVLKQKRLISPGTHNGFEYTSELIRKSVEDTIFTKDNSFLNLNHEDNSVEKWVGEVKNVYWNSEDGAAYGDLWFMDPLTALKLMLGARFAISIKGKGNALMNKVTELIYQNFGVVINPACKTTFLNSEESSLDPIKGGELPQEHRINIKNDENTNPTVPPKPIDEGGTTDKVIDSEKQKGDTKMEEETTKPEATPPVVAEPAPTVDKEKEELKAKVEAYEKEKAEAEEKKKEAELQEIKKELENLKNTQKEMELQREKEREAAKGVRTNIKPSTTIDTNSKSQEQALNELTSDELDEAFAELVMSKTTRSNVWKAD
jgi:hypothetical protein